MANNYSASIPGEVMLSFSGRGSEEQFARLLEDTDEWLHKVSIRGKLRKKLYHIAVEALQNMHHHAEQTHHPEDMLFALGKESEDVYWIVTGNYVIDNQVEKLTRHLEHVNHTSADELKRLYRDRLSCGEISDKGGAGLGIIDIARRSGYPLVYEFATPSAGYAFFCLKIKVSA
ncbi:MAG: SiaB family protein kinase [Bernardetiaceae bacterium]